mgnify:CR=1 FL=1
MAACDKCVGVVGAEEAGHVRQEGFVYVDGCLEVSRSIVGSGKVDARAEGVGVVGAEGVYERTDGLLEGQGGLRTPHLGEAIDRVVHNANDV